MHPYAEQGALAESLSKLRPADYAAWCAEQLTPHAATLSVVGDVNPTATLELAQAAFGAWQGAAPELASFEAPLPRELRELYLFNRPAHEQALVYLGALGPARTEPDAAALELLLQALGDETSGWLARELVERRQLALSASATRSSLLRGPVPLLLRARGKNASLPHLLKALLEIFDALGTQAREPELLARASASLANRPALTLETPRSLADALSRQSLLARFNPLGTSNTAASVELTPEAVRQAAARYLQRGSVIIVGDAAQLALPLSRFGPVHQVDDLGSFAIVKTLRHNPTQELPPLPPRE